MAPRLRNDMDLPRPRRTAGQRILLGLGMLAVVALLTGAGAVAWTAAKFRSIEREAVLLDTKVSSPSNFLIVGSDSRERGNPNDKDGGPVESRTPLADTMMVIRIDPETETVRLLSMPRDLWVTLPNGEKGRLNGAYAHGPQDLIDTIRNELDIPIHHYIEVDFRSFQDVVNAIDGVPIWFDQPMRDRSSGLVVPEAGCITLDGEQALAFARARHLQYQEDGRWRFDGSGDLGRISRQQLFIRRVLDRATDKGFSNPLTMKKLIEVGVDNVTLDSGLSVGTLFGIGERFADFGSDELQTYTVPSTPRTTTGGAQILEIDRTKAEPILARFRDPVKPGTATTTTSTTFVPVTEPFPVTVLNSSGVAGRAEEVASDLVAAGYTIDHYGNGAELGHDTEAATVVRYAIGHEDEARTVAKALDDDVTVEESDELGDDPVVVFLGVDDPAIARTTTSTSTTSTTTAADATTTSTSTPVGVVPGGEASAEEQACG